MGLIDTEPKEGHCISRSETDSRRKIEFGDHGGCSREWIALSLHNFSHTTGRVHRQIGWDPITIDQPPLVL